MSQVQSEDTSETRYTAMMRTLVFESSEPPPDSYYDSTSAVTDEQHSTNPKLTMADGDRRAKKRKQFGLEPEAGKGKEVDNRLHRKNPSRSRPASKVYVPLRSDTPAPRSETPALSENPWPSSSEESSEDSESESSSESGSQGGSDEDYRES